MGYHRTKNLNLLCQYKIFCSAIYVRFEIPVLYQKVQNKMSKNLQVGEIKHFPNYYFINKIAPFCMLAARAPNGWERLREQ
jgi:hypothetical protein